MYHRARPTYHPELVKRVGERYSEGPVLELGAGTGIFTRQMIDQGMDVTAIEPVISMRTMLSDAVPEADIRVGSAEKIPVGDHSFKTVVAAQSFHWFDGPKALQEIERVLEPGGHLVTVWNVRDESNPWMADYTAVIDRYAGDTPRYRSMKWRQAIAKHTGFAPIDEWRIANPQLTDVEGVVDRAVSTSYIAALPDEQIVQVAAEIRRIALPHGPTIEFPYESQLQSWRKISE